MCSGDISSPRHIGEILIERLIAAGVRIIVASPGSRNVPLIEAAARCSRIETIPVVDERQAGFIALGAAKQSGKPIALICTSGSALLNYGPALAEAYYDQIPLIVISADRPRDRIGQNDGQTILQPGALPTILKCWDDIDYIVYSSKEEERIDEIISKTIDLCTIGRKGPVQLNIHIPEPSTLVGVKPVAKKIKSIILVNKNIPKLDFELNSGDKIMVYVGPICYDRDINQVLTRLAKNGVAVLGDCAANLQECEMAVINVDSTVSAINNNILDNYYPDIIITLGGPPTSRLFKKFIMNNPKVIHYDISQSSDKRDTYNKNAIRYRIKPELGLEDLLTQTSNVDINSNYAKEWETISTRALQRIQNSECKWSAQKSIAKLVELLPNNINLCLSNGLSIRYANRLDCRKFKRIFSNRGVSGIEGSTSSALGVSIADKERLTILLTGDMSAYYDISALFSYHINNRLKIVILDNGGGEIFRQIESTRHSDVLENYLCCNHAPDWEKVAQVAGIKFYEASNADELNIAVNNLLHNQAPSLMRIKV